MSGTINGNSRRENELGRALAEYRILEGTANVLRARLELLSTALNEVLMASISLQGLRELQGEKEAFVPIMAGSFIKARITDASKAVVGVGAGVCVEKNLEEAIHDFKGRQTDLERSVRSVQEQLTQVLNELEGRRRFISSIAQQSGGVVRTS